MIKMCAAALVSLVLAGHANAEVCFKDVASYNSIKGQLPATLQTEPLYAINQSLTLTGAFEIVTAGPLIQINAHLNSAFEGVINESAFITEACLSDNQLQVTLSNNKSETITINASSLTIQGYDFDLTNAAGYASVAAKIPSSLHTSSDLNCIQTSNLSDYTVVDANHLLYNTYSAISYLLTLDGTCDLQFADTLGLNLFSPGELCVSDSVITFQEGIGRTGQCFVDGINQK